jgi:DNA-directed RNA polymerase subunit H (RpoH/RPB5)
MSKSSLISSIYKSREVILELLEMQNYDISNYKGIDINEINTLYETSMLDIIVEKNTQQIEGDGEESKGEPEILIKQKMYIHYYSDGKISQTKIQNLIDDLFITEEALTPNDGLLIIVENEPNETINNFIHHIWEKDGVFIIIQSIKRLQFNVLKHELQPKFKILNEIESDSIKKKYNIMNDSNWPEISRFDPVCKATFIRPGQIFEIVRPSKTALISNYYRRCISIST